MKTLLQPTNYLAENDFLLTAVEVFRTNVASDQEGAVLLRALHRHFPGLRATLDLDDCDRVLRVQSPGLEGRMWWQVAQFVRCLNVEIHVLPD